MRSRVLSCIAATTLCGLTILLRLAAQEQQAQTPIFTVLHAFTGSDGAFPISGVLRDAAGNLYGTTSAGGQVTCSNVSDLCGVVFKLDTIGKETVLHSFTGKADGAHPAFGSVLRNAGNVYGTTFAGGSTNCANGGCGVVFKLASTGKETVLHSFTGRADGANPLAGLIRDNAGNLYGTTFAGGSAACAGGCGVVFKLSPTGTETVLHRFTGGVDGANPLAALIRDNAGNLYGTTQSGGAFHRGVVFKLDMSAKETVLHNFTGGADGSAPAAGGGLVRDSAGNLYGTTNGGGGSTICADGCGIVFKLAPTGTETVLHRFRGGADGAHPAAGLVRDSAGNLYGITASGGGLGCGGQGCGIIFRLDATGKETVLHRFTAGKDGAGPDGGLVRDSAGTLYGTAQNGGALRLGVIFKITP
jgi:uncharacterized repeat protein (TIGR03803 family)